MSQIAGPSMSTRTVLPSDGSRTVVVRDSQPPREEESTVGVLQLRAAARSSPRVTWTEDVVDNEGMGKKKSKICCIFHKQRAYDESSSSSSDSDSDSSDSSSDSDSESGSDGGAKPGGRLRNQRRNGHSHPHPHNYDHNHEQNGVNGNGGQATRDGGGGTTEVHELSSDDEYEPNAYERQPGKKRKMGSGKGKGKQVEKDGDPGQPQPQLSS